MHQRTMIWTTAKRCRPGKMRPFHACMLRGKEKPDYPQASAISQSEKQRSIKVESSLSSTTYRYNSRCCTAIGKTNKVSFRWQEKSWASWQCSNAQDPSLYSTCFPFRGALVFLPGFGKQGGFNLSIGSSKQVLRWRRDDRNYRFSAKLRVIRNQEKLYS